MVKVERSVRKTKHNYCYGHAHLLSLSLLELTRASKVYTIPAGTSLHPLIFIFNTVFSFLLTLIVLTRANKLQTSMLKNTGMQIE